MKIENPLRWITVALLFCCSITHGASSAVAIDKNASVAVQGGWHYSRLLDESVSFANQIILHAPDRYGKKSTPLWLAVLNPNAPGLIQEKPANWQSYWDAEDYMMTAQGCNLYRDMPTLAAFQKLSRLTGDDRYQQAVSDYLTFFLKNLPHPTTGLFPWGEHMSYNTVRDTLYANRHELEHNAPEWEMLWRSDSNAVKREIEAIHRFSIYDKENFYYDRHANYYTGAFDPAPVRGSYIKHSGLFAYSFLFLYSKTHDPRHLDWARKSAALYWNHRDRKTDLVPGTVSPSGASGNSESQLLLAHYLLRGLSFYPDSLIKDQTIRMIDAVLKYGFDPTDGSFAGQIVPSTGQALGKANAFSHGEPAESYRLSALLHAYRLTGETRFLQALQVRLQSISRMPLPTGVTPQVAGSLIDLLVDVYRISGEKDYLQFARNLADWSLHNLVRKDLIIESSAGCVYHNDSRPGVLLSAWLRLYETELVQPLHWTTCDAHSGQGGTILVNARTCRELDEITLEATFKDRRKVRIRAKPLHGSYSFALRYSKKSRQGPVHLRFFRESDKRLLDQGEVLLVDSAGPQIRFINFPDWIPQNRRFCGTARVSDSAGIVKVVCHYQAEDSLSGQVTGMEDPKDAELFIFTLPPLATKSDRMILQLEAVGNPAYPMTTRSSQQTVVLAKPDVIAINVQSGLTQLLPSSLKDLSLNAKVGPSAAAGAVDLSLLPVVPSNLANGLPEILLPGLVSVQPADAWQGGDNRLSLVRQYDDRDLESMLPATLSAYQWQTGSWQPVAQAQVDHTNKQISVPCDKGGLFAFGGHSRMGWRRSFNGALLSSPAVARLDQQGTLAIILDTRDADRTLYALDGQGRTLWIHEAGAMQSFPTIADLDQDGLDEVLVGGPRLTVLHGNGQVRWQMPMPNTSSPVVGDITGTSPPEIVVVGEGGLVAAFTINGVELFRSQAGPMCKIPALADLDGDGRFEIIVAGDQGLSAFSGKGGRLWQIPLPGQPMYAPAVADLDGDGRDDIVHLCRTDEQGYLEAYNGKGKLLWQAVVSREPDWSPVVAAMQGDGQPCILAQSRDPRKLEIYDRHGHLLRNLATTGRVLQTPVPMEMDGDGLLDVLAPFDLSYRLWALANDGAPLWSYTPKSYTLPGAKIKGGGSLLVADINGDGLVEIVGGDDETWLNMVRTEIPCKPWAILSGQYHGDCRHSGNYLDKEKVDP